MILKELLRLVIDGELPNDREKLIRYACSEISSNHAGGKPEPL